jgi:hypothetical protein
MPSKPHEDEPEDHVKGAQREEGCGDQEATPDRGPEHEKRPNRWKAARTLLGVIWFIARVVLWLLQQDER